jgi:hypothetical protein
MPPKRGRLPSRADIYAGALSENYVLAYSNSLMDNFIMDVQGSGYIDFGDGTPLNFFSYSGKNGHAYRSIGKVLIDRGEVKKEDMSMQAIREWGEKHSEAEVRAAGAKPVVRLLQTAELCAGERGKCRTADWPRVGGIGSFDYSGGHHAAGGSAVAGS